MEDYILFSAYSSDLSAGAGTEQPDRARVEMSIALMVFLQSFVVFMQNKITLL